MRKTVALQASPGPAEQAPAISAPSGVSNPAPAGGTVGGVPASSAPGGAAPRVSQRAHLARRRAAQERMEREAALGEAFDFLKCGDCFDLLCGVGAAEVMAAGALGAAIPVPLYAVGTAFALALAASVLALAQIGVGMALWAVLKFLSCFNRRVKRPVYYPAERRRRQRLARERRKIRQRRTVNACPTKEALEEQFARAKTSPREMIRFGSMVCDLECYVDNSLVRDECGEIVGRKPGIRGWLNTNCPRLGAKYKTVMRYKAMAEKLKQAMGVGDPVPAAVLAEADENTVRNFLSGRGGEEARECVAGTAQTATDMTRQSTGTALQSEGTARRSGGVARRSGGVARRALGISPWEMAAAWGRAQDFFRCCGRFQTDVIAQLDLRLAPEFAPSGWSVKPVAETAPA